jgi:HEAT repeat protein
MRSLFWLLLFALAFGFLSAQAQTNPTGNDCQTRIEQAVRKLKDANPTVRADAAMELGGFTRSIDGGWGKLATAAGSVDECENLAKEHTRNIAALLKDQDRKVRQSAADALAALGAKEYAPNIAALLEDSDSALKLTAARALADLHAKEYAKGHLKNIAPLLKDSDSAVRCDAISTLATLGAKEYAKDIAALLRDEYPGVREHAISALIDLNAKEHVKDIALLLKREDMGWVKRTAVDALGKLGAKEYAKDIAALLSNKEEVEVRTSAIYALTKLGSKEYAKDIVLLLKDKDFGIRGQGLLALRDLGAKQYAKEIAQLLTDDVPYVRGYAAQALTKLGATEYVKKIAALLMDKDGPVRKTTVQCLKTLEYEPSAKEIFKMAGDAVVWIEVDCTNGKLYGTGFFISVDGRILTNKHVVAATDEEQLGTVESITVTMRDGRSFATGRITTHQRYDLALIQIKNPPKNLTYLHFADELPEVGEDLVIIGHPAGLGWSLSEGRVSQIRDDPDGGKNIWIQTDGAINPGNSGGPMLNRYGQVVSIATKGLDKIGDINVSGLNFGLAISVAKKFLGWQ